MTQTLLLSLLLHDWTELPHKNKALHLDEQASPLRLVGEFRRFSKSVVLGVANSPQL